MSLSHRPTSRKKAFATLAVSVLACGVTACVGQVDEGPQTAVLPLRMLYQPALHKLYDDDAELVEHAVRLSYGIVECKGPKAKADIDWLRTFANEDTDHVSRYKNAVYVAKQGAPGMLPNCIVAGSDVVSAGSFSAIFARPPKTQIEFEIQQLMWMSIRDASDRNVVRYSAAFMQFLAENLGAEPVASAATTAKIDRMEALYDPCRPERSSYDKGSLFACAGGIDAIMTNEIEHLAAPLVATLATQNDAFISQLDAKHASGWRAGNKVKGSALDIQLSNYVQYDNVKVTIDTPVGEIPALEDQNVAQELQILAARRQGVLKAFGLSLSNQLSPAITVKNPRSVPLPPQLADGTLALPGQNDTSTMKAVALSDGSYAVPNPSMHSTGNIVPRWNHWTFVAGAGWKLVGYAGAPIYTPVPERPTALASLQDAADVSGASSLGAPGPAGALGSSAAALKKKPTKPVVSSTGTVASTTSNVQQLITMLLNSLLGKTTGTTPSTTPKPTMTMTPTTPSSTTKPTASSYSPSPTAQQNTSSNAKTNSSPPTNKPTTANLTKASTQQSNGTTTTAQPYVVTKTPNPMDPSSSTAQVYSPNNDVLSNPFDTGPEMLNLDGTTSPAKMNIDNIVKQDQNAPDSSTVNYLDGYNANTLTSTDPLSSLNPPPSTDPQSIGGPLMNVDSNGNTVNLDPLAPSTDNSTTASTDQTQTPDDTAATAPSDLSLDPNSSYYNPDISSTDSNSTTPTSTDPSLSSFDTNASDTSSWDTLPSSDCTLDGSC